MYYQYDAIGNVMDLTDHLGSEVMKYRYDAFDNLFTNEVTPYNVLGIESKMYDPKASLVDFSARWYSPREEDLRRKTAIKLSHLFSNHFVFIRGGSR